MEDQNEKDAWNVVKRGVVVGRYPTIDEAAEAYAECDGDVIRRVPGGKGPETGEME